MFGEGGFIPVTYCWSGKTYKWPGLPESLKDSSHYSRVENSEKPAHPDKVLVVCATVTKGNKKVDEPSD